MRGIAHFDPPVPDELPLSALGDKAMLAITIENEALAGREPQRYQGLVGLEADSLAAAFEGYFRQSEQLPTRILLFNRGDRAAGLLIQQLPESVRSRRARASFCASISIASASSFLSAARARALAS